MTLTTPDCRRGGVTEEARMEETERYKMTKEKRALLEPLGRLVLEANKHVTDLSDAELAETREAMQSVSETNIGWSSYEAARLFHTLLEREARHRERTALATPTDEARKEGDDGE